MIECDLLILQENRVDMIVSVMRRLETRYECLSNHTVCPDEFASLSWRRISSWMCWKRPTLQSTGLCASTKSKIWTIAVANEHSSVVQMFYVGTRILTVFFFPIKITLHC